MPATFFLANGARLTRSKKGDVYYTSAATDCSCPGFTYHHTCKHVKAIQSRNAVEASRAQAKAYQARQRVLMEKAEADPTEANDSILPREVGWRLQWAGIGLSETNSF